MKIPSKTEAIITRTLRTAVLIHAFWDRWLVHGIALRDLDQIRNSLTSIENWTDGWLLVAQRIETSAKHLASQQSWSEAEHMFRVASLYYNLIHWIHPDRNEGKQYWYEECMRTSQHADALSPIETRYASFKVNHHTCSGRIRVPIQPKGCIVIINPIDSTKEELFTYETDFIRAGFVTVSFDGPGQGETYTRNGLKGTKDRWELFMERLIAFTANEFPHLSIHLFGTSLGASWAIYGSGHPLITNTAVVSPAVEFERLHLPTYFLERMDFSCTLVPENRAIPDFKRIKYRSPVLIFHGKKDQMVLSPDMYHLYESLPPGKRIVEYEDEGHCCNHKLAEIRQQAIRWFSHE